VPATQANSVHLVGVCGAGMKALSELLAGSGWAVTGSDSGAAAGTIAQFARRGLRIHPGHESAFVPEQTGLLVYSPAVPADNPERLSAARRRIPQCSYTQMLGRLMQGKTGLSIAGTHGKSTTTAMVGFTLTHAGLDPSVVVGAELREINRGGWSGSGPHFVVESCEYQRHFLDLTPAYAAILGVEPDHFDCFSNLDETIAAFAAFAQRVPASGRLLIPAECDAAKSACLAAEAPAESFSLLPEADWWAADIRPAGSGHRFRVFLRGEYFSEILLRVPGRHNVRNALAAVAMCHYAGAAPAAIREGLAEFAGIRRRFEPVGMWRGATLIDDYAHHPTAVRATLATAREQFPDRRVWCVFQPHQVSRTRSLLDAFSRSFESADETIVLPVFAAREQVTEEPVRLARQLAARICRHGSRARFFPTLDRTLATLDDELRAGDILITMGAGDVGKVHHAFTRRLQQHHPAR
jgi:UDP-N-acetylmuramate--alanine ligase